MPDVLEPPATPAPEPAAKTDDAPATPTKPDTGESWVAKRYQSLAAEKSSRLPAAKPDADKPAGEAAEKEKPKPAAKAKTPKPVPPPAPQPDFEAMGERIAAGVTKGIQPLIAKPAPAPDRTAALRFTERQDYEIIKRLEEKRPDTYKGRSELWLDQLERQQKREEEFYAANPEGEYDPDSEENRAFTKKNSLEDIDSDDFEEAKKELWMAEAEQRAEKRMSPKLAPMESQRRLDSERPAIFGARVKAARTFLGMVGDEFAKALAPDGRILLEEGDKLVAANPANNIPLNLASLVEVFADQVHRLARPDPLPPLDKPKAPGMPYVSPDEVVQIALGYEANLKALPGHLPLASGGSMDDDGRAFATADEYQAMSATDRKRHWKLDGDKIVLMYSADKADEAKVAMQQREADLESYAKAKGYVKNGEQPPANPPPESRPRAPSPPGTIAPNAAPEMTRSAKPNGSENIGWLGSLYGRK